MTAITRLTQTSEVVRQLINDLQAGTSGAQALLEFLKLPAEYDMPAIFDSLLLEPDIQNAFARLRELHPASDYARRGWHRWHVNPDALADGHAVVSQSAPTVINDGHFSTNTVVHFNDMNVNEPTATASGALATNGNYFTALQGGVYRLSTSFCLGFYPTGALAMDFSDRLVEYTAPSFVATPVGFYAHVTAVGVNGPATNPRSYHPLVSGHMSQTDLSQARHRLLGGSIELRLVAGDRVSVLFQRGSRLGRYRRIVSGVSTYADEVIGLVKYTAPAAGGNPARDDQNWVEMVRIS